MSDSPYVRFSQHTLPNGLRVIVAPDRVAPVVAVNLWYDVGSKHEQPGKTGFAHLFEHFMFQGSRHVGKAEHLGFVQVSAASATPRLTSIAPITSRRCPRTRWSWASGWRLTAWPRFWTP